MLELPKGSLLLSELLSHFSPITSGLHQGFHYSGPPKPFPDTHRHTQSRDPSSPHQRRGCCLCVSSSSWFALQPSPSPLA